MLAATTSTFGPGFYAAVLASLFSAAILGTLAFSKKWFRREIIDPIKELKEDFAGEKSKRRRFQKKIVRRMDLYEGKAEVERKLQIAERTRVASPPSEQNR